MATNAINSATNAYTQPQARQTQQADEAKQVAEASAKAQKQQVLQAQETQKPAPMTNTQGQVTGTLINITA